MKLARTFLQSAILLGGVAGLAAGANAAEISFSAPVSVGTPLLTGTTATSGGKTVFVTNSLPQFDTSQGTLTGATVSLVLTSASIDLLAQGMRFGPNNDFGATLTINFTPSLTSTAPDTLNFPDSGATDSSIDVTSSVAAGPYTVTLPAQGLGFAYVATVTLPGLTSSYVLDASDLSAMSGTGMTGISFSLATGGVTSPTGGPVATDFNLDSAVGQETITYEFTPTGVPEPASLGLLGLGALGLLRRRVRRGL